MRRQVGIASLGPNARAKFRIYTLGGNLQEQVVVTTAWSAAYSGYPTVRIEDQSSATFAGTAPLYNGQVRTVVYLTSNGTWYLEVYLSSVATAYTLLVQLIEGDATGASVTLTSPIVAGSIPTNYTAQPTVPDSAFSVTPFNASSNSSFLITNTGNLGIGTTNPGNNVQIGSPPGPIYGNNPLSQSNVIIFGNSPSMPTYAGTGTMGGTLFVNSTNANASNVGASIALGGRGQDFGGGQQHMTFARIQGTQAVTNGAYYGNFVIETQNSGALYERLRIDQNGYVGIGVTNPVALLQVGSGGLCFTTAQNTNTKTVFDAGVNIINGVGYYSGFLQVQVNYGGFDRTVALLYHYCACKNTTGGNVVVNATLLNSAVTASADFNAACTFTPASGTTFNVLLQTSGTRAGSGTVVYNATLNGIPG